MSLFANEPIMGLQPHTKAKLRSTQILTSLPQLVSELVQNSLDANASHIEVGIDPSEWECWVRDDGQGMSVEGMEVLTKGHDKGRYNSSKTYEASHTETSMFGFRGEALASAMELSCLEISSRTSYAQECWSVILKGGEQLYLGPSIHWRREKAGTTVVCRDVFFNVPVRRRSHPNVARTLELTKTELEGLALVFPHVSFSLDHTNGAQKNRILTIPKTSSSLAAFRALYGKAAVERVEELNFRSEDLNLEGFISLSGSHSRGFQNFYVNRHPMSFGEIQRAIEKRFAVSNFSRFALDENDNTSGFTAHAQRSPRKAERKPVYVLNLTISTAQVDNSIEPAKSMVRFKDTDRVLTFMLEVIDRFLARNGFISAPPRSRTESWKIESSMGSSRKRLRHISPQATSSNLPSFKSSSNAQNPSYPDTKVSEPCSTHQIGDESPTARHDGSEYFEWVDPSSENSFLIDSETGNSFPSHRLPAIMQEASLPNNVDSPEPTIQTSYLDRRWLKANASISSSHDSIGAKPAPPAWLINALKSTATFTPSEKSVFSTRMIGSNPQTGSYRPQLGAHTRTSVEDVCLSNLSQSSQLFSQTFSRGDLQNSEVIAQVDTKFIACILRSPTNSERVVALVDQHAADERVRVERYLKRLCIGFLRNEIEKLQLEPPTKILLTRREIEVLERPVMLDALSRWGLRIELHFTDVQHVSELGSTQDREFCQVDVTAVPDVVSKRLANRRELSEFVKTMVAVIEANGFVHWPSPSLSNQEANGWVKALRLCPSPLFELVNSRACRGAIMFNDPLSQRQCERLISQLGETVFPFQCAHGRPSISPLIKLDNSVSKAGNVNWLAFDQEYL